MNKNLENLLDCGIVIKSSARRLISAGVDDDTTLGEYYLEMRPNSVGNYPQLNEGQRDDILNQVWLDAFVTKAFPDDVLVRNGFRPEDFKLRYRFHVPSGKWSVSISAPHEYEFDGYPKQLYLDTSNVTNSEDNVFQADTKMRSVEMQDLLEQISSAFTVGVASWKLKDTILHNSSAYIWSH